MCIGVWSTTMYHDDQHSDRPAVVAHGSCIAGLVTQTPGDQPEPNSRSRQTCSQISDRYHDYYLWNNRREYNHQCIMLLLISDNVSQGYCVMGRNTCVAKRSGHEHRMSHHTFPGNMAHPDKTALQILETITLGRNMLFVVDMQKSMSSPVH